jgi:outer membrane protein TolC
VGLQSQWDFPRATTYPNYGDWTVAVVLQQNLFDGGISRAQRNQAKAQYKQVTSQLQALKEGITLQVKKALLDLESAKERLAAAEKGLTAAKEAYRLAKLGYENQVSTMLDVLSAQTALTGAGVQRAVANFDVQVARTQVLLACGLLPEGLFKPAQAEQAKQ